MNFSITPAIMATLIIVGSAFVAVSAYFGGFVVMLTVVGTSLVALAILQSTELKIRDEANTRTTGNVYASKQAFLRELKEMDARHEQAILGLAQDLGAVSFEKQQLAAKFHRMTDRPRIKGKIVKKADLAKIEQQHPVVDEQPLLGLEDHKINEQADPEGTRRASC